MAFCGVLLAEGLAMMLSGLGVAGIGVALEVRRRGRQVLGQLGLLLLLGMLVPAISCFAAGVTAPRIFSIVLLLGSLPLIPFLGWTPPNTLKGIQDFMGPVTIFESQDVQFAVISKAASVGPGGAVEVTVCAQSCVNGPRGITLKIIADKERGVVGQRHEEDLEPGCVVAFKLTVLVPRTTTDQFRFMVDVLGYGGTPARRIRHGEGRHQRADHRAHRCAVPGERE